MSRRVDKNATRQNTSFEWSVCTLKLFTTGEGKIFKLLKWLKRLIDNPLFSVGVIGIIIIANIVR